MKYLLVILIAIFMFILIRVAQGTNLELRGDYLDNTTFEYVYDNMEDYLVIHNKDISLEQHKTNVLYLGYELWCKQTIYNEDLWNTGLIIWADIESLQDSKKFRAYLSLRDENKCWENNVSLYDYPNSSKAVQSLLTAIVLYNSNLPSRLRVRALVNKLLTIKTE